MKTLLTFILFLTLHVAAVASYAATSFEDDEKIKALVAFGNGYLTNIQNLDNISDKKYLHIVRKANLEKLQKSQKFISYYNYSRPGAVKENSICYKKIVTLIKNNKTLVLDDIFCKNIFYDGIIFKPKSSKRYGVVYD